MKQNSWLSNTVNDIRKLVGEYIWGIDSDTLEGVVANLFIHKKMSLLLWKLAPEEY